VVGQPGKSKSFRERLTRRNALLFLVIFAYAFLIPQLNSRIAVFGYRYHVVPTKTALLVSFVLASIAFYVESSRQR